LTLVTGGCRFIRLSPAERLIAEGEKAMLFDIAAPAVGTRSDQPENASL
jgi:hypothetical protein